MIENVKITQIELSKLEPNEGQIEGIKPNPRGLRDGDFDKLKKSIKEQPNMLALRELIVYPNGDKFVVICGNMRLRALKALKYKTAPCKIIPPEITKDEINAVLILDNSQFGDWDWDMLANEWNAADLSDWGVDFPQDWAGTTPTEEEKEAVEDDFDETKDEVPTICKDGDIWQLGEHRLMCGDSTDPGSVALLMNGEKADLWLTDPPYNVAVENSQGMTIANDNMSSTDFRLFLNKAFAAAYNVMADGCPFYVWFASKEHLNFEGALNDTRLLVRQELVWNKNHFILGRAHYQWKHEPCLYGWKGDSCRYFTNWRNRASVIEDQTEINIDKMKAAEMRELLHKIYTNPIPTTVMDEMKPNKDTDHPTMKPVRLFGYQMQNSSKPDDIVLDTFAGSGTTVIAAEQLGRKARLMELTPHYCDVIIARWEKLTGFKAERLTNVGQPTDTPNG